MIAGFASVLGKQARGTVLLEATQQTKHLTPLQADQHTGVSNTQTTRLNPQQHVKTAELLLAHRQHRHGAPPGTPKPGGVSPLSCRGVSSLYCAYMSKSGNGAYGKFDHFQSDARTLFNWERGRLSHKIECFGKSVPRFIDAPPNTRPLNATP